MVERVVCVTGMPGCGKEEVLKVAGRLGFQVVRMGDVVREEAARRKLPMEDAAVGGMADAERKAHGFGVWAERTVPRVRGPLALVDGVRGSAEVAVFRKAWADQLVVVAVHASPGTRLSRVSLRNRADDAKDPVAFEERDRRELSWGLGEVIARADQVLVNEGSLEAFRREAETFLRRLAEG